MKKADLHAIVDIGSNSIRLVVFGGDPLSPKVLYGDKVVAGLGRGVVARGALDRRSTALALSTLKRFAALLRLIRPGDLQVVATAAVRDASNGPQFLDQVRALGLPVRLLSGEQEAEASGWGVIASHPGAAGLVADLGGGSLELARISGGRVQECVSYPLGVMRIAAIRAGGRGRLRRTLDEAVAPLDWLGKVRGETLYLVGGAWRALDRARVGLLGGAAGEEFPAGLSRPLKARVRELGTRRLAGLPGIKAERAGQVVHAAALLHALVADTGVAKVCVSGAGLREGLLAHKQFST